LKVEGGNRSASHILATFRVITKKGVSAESRNPFGYCDGAEGGI
jgi:hypothetical protein